MADENSSFGHFRRTGLSDQERRARVIELKEHEKPLETMQVEEVQRWLHQLNFTDKVILKRVRELNISNKTHRNNLKNTDICYLYNLYIY